ncbi:MAG: LacI family transcriptional regulator, partial [Tardiphaga sp.]|nr:LacI family transcriptional regulator [Tardiphaga sp.]
GTPQDVIASLHKAAVEAIKDPHVTSKLSSQGAMLVGNTPDEFRAFIASETTRWASVIRDAGVPTEK